VVQKVRDGSNEIEVEIAPNVRVTIAKDTLSTVLTQTAPAAAHDAK
jgi:preprotein translocase subunit YajC